MLDQLKNTLRRLRGSLARKAERAYDERDAARDSQGKAYAEGQGHAYAVAEGEVRDAETASEADK